MTDDRGRRPPPAESPWANARVQPKTDAKRRNETRVPAQRDASPQGPSGQREEGRPNAPRRNAHRHDVRRRDEAQSFTSPRDGEARVVVNRHAESRLYGLNACLAAFARRPLDLRKVYLVEARIPALRDVLAWCVQHRLGYRVVEQTDLDKLTSSRHHEGVCFEMTRTPGLTLDALLEQVPAAPAASLLLWLDGVGNPHNLGALLRSAAHFGVGGVVVPRDAGLDVSGAAARVAEGAAEIVPMAQVESASHALQLLRAQGYAVAATVPRDGVTLYDAALPRRLVLVFGAEGEGMSAAMIEAADLRLSIPGSGAIESLNVAASVAVVLGEAWRQGVSHATVES